MAVVLLSVLVFAAPALAATEDLVRNLTITSTTIDSQTKVVTVRGAVTCAPEVNRAFVGAEVSQVVGRLHTVRGYGEKVLECNGRTPFVIRMTAYEGRFAPGEPRVRGFAGACLRFERRCDFDRLSLSTRRTPT